MLWQIDKNSPNLGEFFKKYTKTNLSAPDYISPETVSK